jgi:iron complex outermembrane receptor protein
MKYRNKKIELGILLAIISTTHPIYSQAQQSRGLEEVIVSAQRRETNLQETPLSVAAFSASELQEANIQTGSELGIMVPNVVLNPGTGQGQSQFFIRGMPGVGVYVDGVWQGSFGFQQTNFVEMERVEVLRGPQGTLFGRNTNGGAINITTKKPADEFGARITAGVGQFNRKDLTAAVDVPISDTLKTKFMVSSLQNDGFLKGKSTPWDFGGQNDLIIRSDVLWEPSDNFSLRLTANDEDKSSSDARIVRFTNTNHPRFKAHNIIIGNPDYLSAIRAIDPSFPSSPVTSSGNRFGPTTHEPGFAGGQLGKWESKSDGAEDGIRSDLSYYTLTAEWSPSDYFNLTAIFSDWEMDRRQVIDFDGSEYIITTDDIRDHDKNTTMEFRITGEFLEGKANYLLGYYALELETRERFYRWGLWDFAQPNNGPSDPPLNGAALGYVRSYGATIGDPSLASYFPIVLITDDALSGNIDEDSAFYGELSYQLTDKIEATVGVRITGDDGRAMQYTPTEAFRTQNPGIAPAGDSFAGQLINVVEDPDLGNITTNKFAITYQHSDDLMLYANWGEGFTSGGQQNVNNVGIVTLNPEIVTTWELGLRSDWMEGKLRFNGTYFNSDWDGMRVQQLPPDPNNPGASLPFPYPTSDGKGEASGFEFDVTYIPIDDLVLTFNLGLIDTSYIERGVFDGTNGISPNSPFAYAADQSFSLGALYDWRLKDGSIVTFSGKYGWMGEYARDSAFQRTRIDSNGNIIMEPSYGILNGRVTYHNPADTWSLSLWGNNLTDEQYVNGGFDTRNVWGYDFSVIGRSREIGLTLSMEF